DNCSGKLLTPKQTCTVSISFVPAETGPKRLQLSAEYGRNIVPFPALTTITTLGPNPLVTGTVTIPLPATMAAGSQAPFQFTYTNTNNGTVTGVVSPGPNINPNPGGSGAFVGPITNTCATLPFGQLPPGASCVVSGTFRAGIPGNYTVNDSITYNGGSG